MLKTILIVLGVLLIIFMLVFVYSCCVISGRCSREEEKRNGLQ